MATAKFTSVEEFLEELNKEDAAGKFDNPGWSWPESTILRLTNLFSPIPNLGPIRSLTVVATVKVRDDIIRLNRYCGQIWDMEKTDNDTYKRAEAVHKQIEEAAKKLGVEVRAGMWEE